jgi:integrase
MREQVEAIRPHRKIKGNMKTRTGTVRFDKERGAWYARVCFTDPQNGKRKEKRKYGENKTEANKLRLELVREIERGKTIHADEAAAVKPDKLRFADLARRYEEARLIPARYVGETKVAGMRNTGTPKLFLSVLNDHFGHKLVREITHADIEAFKIKRFDTPTRPTRSNQTGQRTIASVNRELECLRTVLRFAERQGWLARNPFNVGTPLINKAAETKRERVMSVDEERRLLSACAPEADNGARLHLRPIIIAAVDTGLRRGELLKMTWGDVEFDHATKGGWLRVRAINAKTGKARIAAMTQRLYDELVLLWGDSKDLNTRVFGITNHFRRAWNSACKRAKITGLRFHDLRATFATRAIQAGMPEFEVMKITGHTQKETFDRYVRPQEDRIRAIAESVELWRLKNETDLVETQQSSDCATVVYVN